MALIPEFNIPEFIEESLKTDHESIFKRSIDFDFKEGGIKRDGKNNLANANFIKTFNDWVVKALSTERGTCDFYSDNYGAEFEKIFRMNDRKQQEMAIEKTVTETILADDLKRARYINGFKFNWQVGSVEVKFNVFTDKGELPIIYNIEKRR